ncbi:MAG: chalcone isomerase family protein [Chromatiales bacterium]|jgi:hypothetical protein
MSAHAGPGRHLLLGLCLGLLLTPGARASEVVRLTGEVAFPTSIRTGDRALSLMGAGLLRYALFIKVYGAGLYAPEGTARGALLDPEVPKRLELHYLIAVSRDDIDRAARVHLERQLTPAQMAAIDDDLERLHRLLADVGPGDRYGLTVEPPGRLRVDLNGRPLGVVDSPALASAYMGIWVGDTPIAPQLKRELLGDGEADG